MPLTSIGRLRSLSFRRCSSKSGRLLPPTFPQALFRHIQLPKCFGQVFDFTDGAGEGNRTLVISLEGCCSTIELHPRTQSSTCEPAFAKAAAPCLRDRPACQPQRRRREGWWGR